MSYKYIYIYIALKYAFGMTNIYKIEMYFIFLDLFYQIWICQKIHQSYLSIVDVCDIQKNKKMLCSLHSECQSSHLIKNKYWSKINSSQNIYDIDCCGYVCTETFSSVFFGCPRFYEGLMVIMENIFIMLKLLF